MVKREKTWGAVVTEYTPVELIEVRIWGRSVGAVAYDPTRGCYAFGYSPEWISSGIELSPFVMPNRRPPYVFPNLDRDTFHGLPGMLADALPDAFGNAVIDAWLTTSHIDKEKITTLDRLAYAGERAMGALTFHPSARAFTPSATAIQIADIVQQAREVIAGKIATADTTHDALQQLIQVGSSAGGARPKAVVLLNPQTDQIRSAFDTIEPGFEPWILKLDGVEAAGGVINSLDAPHQYTRIEYAYSLMADFAGIEMAQTRLLLEGPRAHFLTKRFDRALNGDRIHMQSLCGLDHLDYRYKDTHSYDQYLITIRRLGLDSSALAEGFRRMVFNVAAMNRDDHTKNFAFLLPQGGTWKLSPAFDITHAYNPQGEWTQRHQMSINGKFEKIALTDLHSVGDAHGIPAYRSIVQEVLEAVSQWQKFATEANVNQRTVERISDEMRTHQPR
jgi:serine/threonine-protein kinase HipA